MISRALQPVLIVISDKELKKKMKIFLGLETEETRSRVINIEL